MVGVRNLSGFPPTPSVPRQDVWSSVGGDPSLGRGGIEPPRQRGMSMAGRTLATAWHRHAAGQDDPRLVTSFAAGLGFTVTLMCGAVMTHLRGQVSPAVDLGIFVAVVALASWWMAWLGAKVTAGLAFLMLNGFVLDQYAVLRWRGSADLARLVVLLGCAGAAVAARELQLRHQHGAAEAQLDRELAEITRTTSLSAGGPRHA